MPLWLTIAQQASLPALAFSLLLLAITAFIKVLPQLKRVQMESDTSLRGDLLSRVQTLENEVVALRKAMDQERASHAAEIADLQHDLTNETFSFDTFIMLAEANPDKALEQVPAIKENRRQHKERMAMKRAVREGAAIAAAESGTTP